MIILVMMTHTDLKSIVNKLEEKNYDGIYIIEVNDTDSIKKSYEYMKRNF